MKTIVELLKGSKFVVVDTETTGLNSYDEVVQVGILSPDGTIIMDELVKPTRQIPIEAQMIHGITNQMVEDKRTIAQLEPRLRACLEGHIVVAYNADFDMRMLWQSLQIHSPESAWLEMLTWVDVMKPYANFRGGKWQRLANACAQLGIPVVDDHSAIGDCRLTLAILQKFGV